MEKIVKIGGLVAVFWFLFTSSVRAENKVGINIAARHEEYNKAADIAGPGGWIAIMASPGNADEIKPYFSSRNEVNLILRGHCPSDPLGPDYEKNRKFALSWTATLGGLETGGRKIFFMPWNEPNMTRECQGAGSDSDPNNTACAPYVGSYINNLKQYLNDGKLGNLGGKVALLSPMINQFHPNFDAFVSALGGPSFFNGFAGISMNLYDNETCGGPLCSSDPHQNAGQFERILNQMGAGQKAFAVETGIVDVSGTCPSGVTDCSVYEDRQMAPFIREAWTKSWGGNWRLRMFSPLSYNPEINPPSWIYGSNTAGFMQSIRGGGDSEKISGFDQSKFLNWREEKLTKGDIVKCPGTENAFAADPSFCGACGGAGVYIDSPQTRLDECNPRLKGNELGCPAKNEIEAMGLPATVGLGGEITVPWAGTVSLFDKSLTLPYAKKLADFFEGPFYNPQKLLEFSCDTNPRAECFGPSSKLLPQKVQDALKKNFIERIKKQELSDYKIGGQPVSGLTFPPDDPSRRVDWAKEFWAGGLTVGEAWARAPMFTRNDATGSAELTLVSQSPDAKESETFLGDEKGGKTKINLAVPHLARLFEATKSLWQILLPSQNEPALPAPTCEKDYERKDEEADFICSKEEIAFRNKDTFKNEAPAPPSPEEENIYNNPALPFCDTLIPPEHGYCKMCDAGSLFRAYKQPAGNVDKIEEFPNSRFCGYGTKTYTPKRVFNLTVKIPFIAEIWNYTAGKLGFLTSAFNPQSLSFEPLNAAGQANVKITAQGQESVRTEKVRFPFLGGIMKAKEDIQKSLNPYFGQ